MELTTIRETIINASADDWHVVVYWGTNSGPSYLDQLIRAVCKPDVQLGLAYGLGFRGAPDGGAERLDVDWARRFADEKVTASWVDVLWNGALVDRELVYNADGGRVILPASQVMYHTESPSDRTEIIGEYVTQWEYHLARIVAGFEGQRDFEGDFERAGFTLLDHYVNGLGPGL